MDTTPVTVAIVSPYRLGREALAALLASLPGFEIVPPDGGAMPGVYLWDVMTAGAAPSLDFVAGTPVLALAAIEAAPGLLAHVAGIVLRDEPPENLAAALRQVARGDQYFSPDLVLALLRRHGSPAVPALPAQPGLAAVTDRERDVLAALAAGLSNKAIAARLYLSVRTVEGHLANLYAKLGVRSRAEAIVLAVRHGLGPQNT